MCLIIDQKTDENNNFEDNIMIDVNQMKSPNTKTFLLFILFAIMMFSTSTTLVDAFVVNAASREIYLYRADQLNVGDYVNNFGTYNSRGLRWRVISKDTQGVMLQTDRILSDANGDGEVKPYSDTSDTVPDGYPHKSEFINDHVQHRTAPANQNASYFRTNSGTNYWEQSTARYFLNNEFIDSFDQEQQDAMVLSPTIHQLLYWTEVSPGKAGEDGYAGFNAAWITGDQGRPQYVDYIAEGNVATAESYSGKKTYYSARLDDGNYVAAVYMNATQNRSTTVPFIYDNSPYYDSNDTVFFAPANILQGIRDSGRLKNQLGKSFVAKVDYNDTLIHTYTSMPTMRTGNSPNDAAAVSIVTADSNGDFWNYYANGTTNSAGYAPSIYLKNDTVLKLLGNAANNSGENGTYYDYELSTETAQSPTILTTNFDNMTVGQAKSFGITTNTQDLEISLSSGSLPDGISLDTDNFEIKGTPTKVGIFDFTLSVTNNFGSSNKNFSIAVEKGTPTPSTIPSLTANTGNTIADIKGQVPADWRILTAETYEFTVIGDEYIDAVYNPDSANWIDAPYKLTVKVSAGTSSAPAPDDIPSVSGKVGQRLADLSLPNKFSWQYPDTELKQVGEITTTLLYNEDSVNFSDYKIEDFKVTVDKGDPISQTPPTGITAVYKQTTADIVGQLPTGWRFKDENFSFDSATVTSVDALYNPDQQNYNDYETTILVDVAKGNEVPPSTIPTFNAVYGQTLQDISGDLPNYMSWETPDFEFTSVGDISVWILYNTDPSNLIEYRFSTTVSVAKGAPQTPPSIPTLTAKVGDTNDDLIYSLPLEWSFVEQNYFDQVGIKPVKLAYNPNNQLYQDNIVTVDVKVVAGQQSAPPSIPEFRTLIGYTADETVAMDGFPKYFGFVKNQDQDIVFDTLAPQGLVVTMYYNTDPVNLLDYVFQGLIIVDLRDGLTPSEIPSGLQVTVGNPLSIIELPQYFRWADSSLSFDTVGTVKATVVYNEDPNMYKDTAIEVEIKVNSRPTLGDQISDLLTNPFVLLGSAVGVAFVIFLIIFFIVKTAKKDKKAPVTVVGARPATYGRNNPNNMNNANDQGNEPNRYGPRNRQLPHNPNGMPPYGRPHSTGGTVPPPLPPTINDGNTYNQTNSTPDYDEDMDRDDYR